MITMTKNALGILEITGASVNTILLVKPSQDTAHANALWSIFHQMQVGGTAILEAPKVEARAAEPVIPQLCSTESHHGAPYVSVNITIGGEYIGNGPQQDDLIAASIRAIKAAASDEPSAK